MLTVRKKCNHVRRLICYYAVMTTYLALLRGVNVGGKALLKMADLHAALSKDGFQDVKTYIQSGNVMFTSNRRDKKRLASDMSACIEKNFKLTVDIAHFTADEWQAIVKAAPAWWGKDADWKHNLLVITTGIPAKEVVAAIGELKPDIEAVKAGDGVVYQSMSFTLFGRTTTGKLASNPIYKKLTVRNYNTATKLANLLSSKSGK